MTRRPPPGTPRSGESAAVESAASAISRASPLSQRTTDNVDERNRQSLHDIADFCSLAADLVSRGREAYDGDRMLQLAAEAVITRIGEAVGRLDPPFVSSRPEVPFRQAKGMRNLVSHEYRRTDPEIVWGTLVDDIPPFCAQVNGILLAWPRP